MVLTDITFRGLEPDPLLEAEVHRLVRWLEHALGDAIGCRVELSLSQRRRDTGRTAEVLVEALVPGLEPIIVERISSLGRLWSDFGLHAPAPADAEDVHRQMRIALADAFTTMRRRVHNAIELRRDNRRSA